MKKILLLISIFAILFLSNGCKKEAVKFTQPKIEKSKQTFSTSINWSKKEKDFFAFDEDASRSSNFTVLNPLVEAARQEMIRQNEEYNFVDGISSSVGHPVWIKSNIVFEPSTKKNVVIIPMESWETRRTNGIITVIKKMDGGVVDGNSAFSINAVSKHDVLKNERGKEFLNNQHSKWLLNFDSKNGLPKDRNLEEVFCQTQEKIQNNSLTGPSGGECEWITISVCFDETGQDSRYFISSSGGKTFNSDSSWFDGDHDNDGIPDDYDDDYDEWFTKMLPILHDFWNTNYPDIDLTDAFDGDHDNDGILDGNDPDYQKWYDNFLKDWNVYFPRQWYDWFDGDHDNDGIPDENDQDYEEWRLRINDYLQDKFSEPREHDDGFYDFWDDLDQEERDDWMDYWDELWDDDDTSEGVDVPDLGYAYDDYDGDCRDYGFSESNNQLRGCPSFLVKYCGGSLGDNWWDTFDEVIDISDQNATRTKLNQSLGGIDRDVEDWITDHPELWESVLNGQLSKSSLLQLISLLNHNLGETREGWPISQEILSFIYSSDDKELAIQIATNIDKLARARLLESPPNSEWFFLFMQGLTLRNPALANMSLDVAYHQWLVEIAELRKENPYASDYWLALKAGYNVASGAIHMSLDGVGLIPAVGNIGDLVNGVLYLLEGDGANARWSFAAMIPIAGIWTTAAKYVKKTVKYVDAAGKIRKTTMVWTVGKNGLIDFGKQKSSQLRKLLPNYPGPGYEAHHLIPWAKGGEHELVQMAASLLPPFHLNYPANGAWVKKFRNKSINNAANHNIYDAAVVHVMDVLLESLKTRAKHLNRKIKPEEIRKALSDLQKCLSNIISNHPDVILDDLESLILDIAITGGDC